MSTTNTLPSIAKWRAYFQSRGLQPEIVRHYIEYIAPIAKRGLPVIFELEHLGRLFGRDTSFVAKLASGSKSFYRDFNIPKRSGGVRYICAPYPSLKECQRWILDEILYRLKSHPATIGYRPGKSILDHAKKHCRQGNSVLIIDIKDFFPSIKKARVIRFFSELGYSREICVALAGICTLEDSLPQGAPTSPTLSNLMLQHMDERLTGLSRGVRIKYSRYADDLCFSGPTIPRSTLISVTKILEEFGFCVNDSKVRFLPASSGSQMVTGINISQGKLRPAKRFRRELEQSVHFIGRYGFHSHVSKLKIRDPAYLSKLRGRLEHWRFIEPENSSLLKMIEVVKQAQAAGWGGQ